MFRRPGRKVMRVNATQISKDPQGCRTSSKRKLLSAGLIAGLVAVLSGIPATAGTSASPDISDPAGDANFASAVSGDERDTRPASTDNGDLRAVWFETAYSTTKVRDASGAVLRVEHQPTALLINIKTQSPVRPLSPLGALRFKVLATAPACTASFELLVAAASEKAEIRPAAPSTGCGEDPPLNLVISPVTPTYNGAVSTMTFPLAHEGVSKVVSAGTVLSQTKAQTISQLSTGAFPVPLDQTSAGSSFTIGQDVPADVDCMATPDNTECQS
jgi:hypothetical protein